MGSVKDLVVFKNPDGKQPGLGKFVFSDRYSVFDWGEMPDHINDKGKAICVAAAYLFEKLEQMNVPSHYLGVVTNSDSRKLNQTNTPASSMNVKLLRVLKPELRGSSYDYSVYKKEDCNFLIPLEIIYRNSLPAGSSVFKRLKDGSLKLEALGFSSMPEPGHVLEKPILDVSTKLESTDRYISWDEAKEMANLSNDELKKLKEQTLKINDLINQEVGKLGLFNEDGKVEFGFDEGRNIILVDALGTLDECRFTFNGLPVSKEIARIHYRKTDWFKDIESAKKKDIVNWKKEVKNSPPPLPAELANSISLLYKAYTNELTGKQWFTAPPLVDVLNSLNP
jgi:phosphoribosylaminoimidazole-succinocarboxamide synthase